MQEIPTDFFDDVKDALEHLYDFPALQKHSLSLQYFNTQNAAQDLRRALLDAIEKLNPGTDVYFRSPHARLYNLVHLYYVEGMTMQEVSDELGISQRQAYRDLKKAQESIAEIFWHDRPQIEPSSTPQNTQSVQSEVERLEGNIQVINLNDVVESAWRAVERLADTNQKTCQFDLPTTHVNLTTVRPVALQILVNLLSHSIQNSQSTEIHIRLHHEHPTINLTLEYTPKGQQPLAPIIQQLVDNLGWRLTYKTIEHQQQICLSIQAADAKLLIIDDNEGILELFDRYLSDMRVQLLFAKSPLEGLAMLETLTPDLIILDVMMPEMDGWELLQRIRALPQTMNTAVLVCSVFNDPELATSLGANGFINKPIDKDKVLTGLRSVGIL